MSPFFIDCHPQYQADLDFRAVKEAGYVAAIIKISQGTDFVPPGLGRYVERAVASGLLIGFYHWIERGRGDAQADHFVRTGRELGGFRDRLAVVDFEPAQPGGLDPTNDDLRGVCEGFKERVRAKTLGCYSGQFWNEGIPSGDARTYGIDYTWDARYPYDRPGWVTTDPRATYRDSVAWYWEQRKWGYMSPSAWQFTGQAQILGQEAVDVNRFFGSREDMLELAS